MNIRHTKLVEQFINSLVVPATTKLFIYRDSNKEYFLREVDRLFKKYPLQGNPMNWSLEEFTAKIKYILLDTADTLSFNIITPWTIELGKDFNGLTNFLGPVRKLLPVVVIVGSKQYVHQCSSELIFGVLSVVNSSSTFTFYLLNTFGKQDVVPITLQDIAGNYTSKSRSGLYSAILPIGQIKFNTIDVIQGIITGASWLKEDPHKYITNITRDGILVTF